MLSVIKSSEAFQINIKYVTFSTCAAEVSTNMWLSDWLILRYLAHIEIKYLCKKQVTFSATLTHSFQTPVDTNIELLYNIVLSMSAGRQGVLLYFFLGSSLI